MVLVLVTIQPRHQMSTWTPRNSLTRRWDIYLKEGSSDYASINPQNLQPVFSQHQLASSLRATNLAYPIARAASLMDSEKLLRDIHANLANDATATKYLGQTSEPRWRTNNQGFLLYDDRLYIPDAQDVGCRNALNNNPNIFLSNFLYLFILFLSDNFQTCTKYLQEIFLIFIYFIKPENLFFKAFFIRRHFGRCLPNGFAAGGEL
jgi:hypothetical protein